ncbi:ribonuclease domain-containing protein [Paenibacillus sp. IITD108]
MNFLKASSRVISLWLASIVILLSVVLGGCSQLNLMDELEPAQSAKPLSSASSKPQISPTATPPAEQSDPGNQEATDSKPLTSFSEVAEYLRTNGKLPPNFITKSEASALGWDAKKLNLDKVAPGKSIGGDRFGNREGLLPSAKGRIWYEADIHYKSGGRGADRIVFSNDGLIYMTTDHYKSFTDITAKGP